MIKFPERLKELRLMLKLSQKAAAEIFDVTQSSFSDWELGISEPSLKTIEKMCEYFEVTSDYLIGLSEI